MSHQIFLKYFIEYLLFCSTHGFDIELYGYANCTYCELVYLIGTYIMQQKNCWAQPWLSFGILQAFRWSWECIRYFVFDWYRILFWNFEICTIIYIYISLFSLGWWHTLMKNKHQISLYLGLKKWPTFCRWNCQMDFPLKKILSVCLSVCQSICPSISLSVRLSVSLSVCLCLSHLFHYALIMVSSWNFQEWLPMIEVIDVYAKVQGQKSKFKVTEVKTQISRFGTITPVWLHIWWWNDAQSLILFRSGALLIFKVICQISRSRG